MNQGARSHAKFCNREDQKAAISNLKNLINTDNTFPQNVFKAELCQYHFFDSDLIFNRNFSKVIKGLLETIGGTCVVLCNLDEVNLKGDFNNSSIFLDEQITENNYFDLLRNASSNQGWIFGMERFGLTSDTGTWCVYCEKNNEMAVIGFQKPVDLRVVDFIQGVINTLPIAKAIEHNLGYGFSSRALTPEWRNRLTTEYP